MSEQVMIVTGGGGNIGTGLCPALRPVPSRSPSISTRRARTTATRRIKADLTNPKACAETVDEVIRDFGRIDTLVDATARDTHRYPVYRHNR